MTPSHFSAFCLAAAHSGSGKTTLAAGLLRVYANRGLVAQGFKCGPDYVDPSFHAQASGRAAFNLDTWMMGRNGVQRLFARHAAQTDVVVCEGVMGLLDGRDVPPGEPDGSTLDCAAALNLPLVLVVSARGMGASVAALVEGFVRHAAARGVRVVGVIANQTGSPRHTAMLQVALEKAQLPPLLGALPRDPDLALPERQLGLVPAQEAGFTAKLATLAAAVECHIDLDRLLELTRLPRTNPIAAPSPPQSPRGTLAIAKDEAFCFYYEENETALRQAGWELAPFSPLRDSALPVADALYLGGGYPEVFAAQLAANTGLLASIREHAAAGKEIWAECGGFMLLCRELVDATGRRFPLTGVLDATAHMGDRLRSLGYREVCTALPFGLASDEMRFQSQNTLRGHEFHWSRVTLHTEYAPLYAGQSPELGIRHGAVSAGYVHVYWGDRETSAHATNTSPTFAGGRVILLNGPSSSGKTSLAAALRTRLREAGHPVMVISMDDFLRGCAYFSALEAEAAGFSVVDACHAAVAEAARRGMLVIADHVIGDDPRWLPDLLTRLGGIPVHGVHVRCATDELLRREQTRTDRPANPEHTLRQQARIHCPLPDETDVDTTAAAPALCADRIVHQLLTATHRS